MKNKTKYECWDCGDFFVEKEIAAFYNAEENELGLSESDPDYGKQFYRCIKCDGGV